MPKDKKTISLDPMEWRDAMKDVGPAKKKAPAKPAKKTTKAPAKKKK